MNRLPDFLIIGAAKSGTTSLYYYLGQHPSVYFPTEIKEPSYLCFADHQYEKIDNNLPDLWKSAITELSSYRKLFYDAPDEAILGEATPEYLFLADQTIANIKSLYGEQARKLKFVIILRNPIARIWSHYWMMKRDGYENLSYAEATNSAVIEQRLKAGWHPAYDYIGYGMYGHQLQSYLEHFSSEQFHILLFDDFKHWPINSCQEIFSFLGVDSSFIPDVSVKHNLSGRLKFPMLHRFLFTNENFLKHTARSLLTNQLLQYVKSKILHANIEKVELPQDEHARLLALYREDIHLLSSLINRDLTSWLTVKSD